MLNAVHTRIAAVAAAAAICLLLNFLHQATEAE
jgi:hypothetical protein